MPLRVNVLPPREPDENVQIPGHNLLDLGRVPARSIRSVGEQQEDNEDASNTGTIARDIEDLPRIRIKGKDYVKEGHVHSLKERRSHVWNHGYGLIELPNQKRHWACKFCDNKGIYSLFVSSSTGNASDHLQRMHKVAKPKRPRDVEDDHENDSLPSTPGSQASSGSSDQGTLPGIFNRPPKKPKQVLYPEELVEAFKERLIKWLVAYHIPLVDVEKISSTAY
jgi:hypothetical protein